jgi:hypothetical protein
VKSDLLKTWGDVKERKEEMSVEFLQEMRTENYLFVEQNKFTARV